MTDQERHIIHSLSEVWNDYLGMKEQHPADKSDFRKAIHDAQRIIMGRAGQRMLNRVTTEIPNPEEG